MSDGSKNVNTLIVAGDTSLGDYYIRRLNNSDYLERLHSDPFSFFSGVYPLVNKCDHFIVNLESVLANNPGGSLEGKKFCNWDNPQRTINILKKLGVTAVNLANNHSMDYGPDVLISTLEMLEGNDIKVLGAGHNLEEASKPLKIELKGHQKGQDIYLLACMLASERYRNYGFFAGNKSPGVYELDIYRLKNQVASICQENPGAIIIILPHWQGRDYKKVSTRARQISKDLIKTGANYVIAQGTHMADAIEAIEKGIIAHSIGNFVFNSPGRYKKFNVPPYSLIFQLELIERENGWQRREKFYPLLTDNRITDFTTRPANDKEAISLLGLLKDRIPPDAPGKLTADRDSQGHFFYVDNGDSSGNKAQTAGQTELEDRGSQFENLAPVLSDMELNIYDNVEKPFSTKKHLATEFEKLGYQSTQTKNYLKVLIDSEEVLFLETESSLTSLLAWRILKNKVMAREFFENAGLSVARGRYFSKNNKIGAKKYALALGPCVIKPSDGRKGKGITVGVNNERGFEYAWKYAVENCKKGILVEEQFNGGTEARYLVVDSKCVAVVKRIPPAVKGNGADAIEKLVEKKNQIRLNNPHLCNRLIKIDPQRKSNIRLQGYELNSILPEGKQLILDWKAGLSSGAESYDYTDEVHPSFKRIAEKTASAIPGLDIAGIDILARDHTQDPNPDNYIIIEANTRPGIGGHHYPAYGRPRNVAGEIAKYIIRRIKDSSSPENT